MTRLLLKPHAGWGKARLLRLVRVRALPKIPPLSLRNICRLEQVRRKHGPYLHPLQLPLFPYAKDGKDAHSTQ